MGLALPDPKTCSEGLCLSLQGLQGFSNELLHGSGSCPLVYNMDPRVSLWGCAPSSALPAIPVVLSGPFGIVFSILHPTLLFTSVTTCSPGPSEGRTETGKGAAVVPPPLGMTAPPPGKEESAPPEVWLVWPLGPPLLPAWGGENEDSCEKGEEFCLCPAPCPFLKPEGSAFSWGSPVCVVMPPLCVRLCRPEAGGSEGEKMQRQLQSAGFAPRSSWIYPLSRAFPLSPLEPARLGPIAAFGGQTGRSGLSPAPLGLDPDSDLNTKRPHAQRTVSVK